MTVLCVIAGIKLVLLLRSQILIDNGLHLAVDGF